LLDRALFGASKQRPEYPRQRRPVVAAGALGARWRLAAADLGMREREGECVGGRGRAPALGYGG
jgi:hypothetical protein